MKGNYAGGDLELSKKLASQKKYLILIALKIFGGAQNITQ